ncbi:nucleoside triphosphate pyrophosphohydrolase [Virgibacillus soli]|uniref:nucleoside triphosphate pyrophosphohydrolase n=1 Tax=Paracerasibacillus soli TaxID=480284 RepID=UPI0035E6F04C
MSKHKIEVIGLGGGDINQLPFGVYKKLTTMSNKVFVRTMDHPVIEQLQAEGVPFSSFDAYYEQEKQFEEVYIRIVNKLLLLAQSENVVYAVPGHPMLAERTVQLLIEQDDVEVEIMGGQSYLDDLFTSLKIDPIDGFQFIDATDFQRSDIQYKQHIIFCQVYNQFIASELKLTLLEDLPSDYEVTIVEAAGSSGERLITMPLEELDHNFPTSNLISVYIPPVEEDLLSHTFTQLRKVIATLRGPNGCPWDQKQTHETLRPYVLEEAYELIEAIDAKDDIGIEEELGDLLLQVMLHSQIGEETGYFTIDDVIKGLTKKMIHRHPHVFGDVSIQSIEDVNKNWESIKQEEKGETRSSILDGIPEQYPALLKAYKLQEKAAKVGFDWDNSQDIWAKLTEEVAEVKEAISLHNQEEIEKEFGDVLFVMANLTRYYNIQPEVALNRTNRKFQSRFTYIERKLREQEKDIHDATLLEMDNYWNEAKKREG